MRKKLIKTGECAVGMPIAYNKVNVDDKILLKVIKKLNIWRLIN